MKKIYFVIFSFVIFIISFITYNTIGYNGYGIILNGILYNLPPFLAVLFGVYAVFQYGIKSVHGEAFAYVAAGIFCWFVGEMIYTIMQYGFNYEPFPSFTDLIYIAGYPIMTIGLFKEISFASIKWDTKKVAQVALLSMLLFTATITASYFFAYKHDNTALEKLINIIYNVGDFVLVFLLVFLTVITHEYKEGKIFESWTAIFIGILFTFLADIFYGLLNPLYIEGEKSVMNLDLLYIAGYLCIAYGFFTAGFIVKEAQKELNISNVTSALASKIKKTKASK